MQQLPDFTGSGEKSSRAAQSQPRGNPSMHRERLLTLNMHLFRWIAFLGPLVALTYGLTVSGVLLQQVWNPTGLNRLIGLALAYSAVATAMFYMRARTVGVAIACGVLFFAIISVGAGAVAALLVFLAASHAVGSIIARAPVTHLGAFAEVALQIVTGMAAYVCLTGFLAHFPVSYPELYWFLVLAPVAIRWRVLRKSTRLLTRKMAGHLEARVPRVWAAGALTGLFLLAHFLVALKPEVSHDGLSMHLYVPAFVAAHHHWTFDTAQVAWAAMPMGGDWAYTFVYMLGGESAARLLNFSALVLLVSLLVTIGSSIAGRTVGLLLGTAFLSSPVVQLVTGSMFIDNFLALWLFAAFTIAACYETSLVAFYAGALLLGTAAQTKLGSVPALTVLAVFLTAGLYQTCRRRQRTFLLHFAAFGALLLLTAIPPYAVAWLRTKNPFYPVPLAGFSATLTPLDSTPFHDPLNWTVLYELTFESGRFLESQNGSLGLHYILLIPLAAVGCCLVRDRTCRIALITAMVSAIAIYLGSSNIRYLYSTLALFVIAGAAGFLMLRSSRLLVRGWFIAMSVLAGLNLYLLPASGWYHKDFFLPDSGSREQYRLAFHPTATVTDYLNLAAPGVPVAFLGTNQIAPLAAVAYTMQWPHGAFRDQVRTASNSAEMLGVMRNYGVSWFMTPERPGMLPVALRHFLSEYTAAAFTSNGWQARQVTANALYRDELLINGDFGEGVKQWSVFGNTPVHEGRVQVNLANTISQSFETQPGARYLYSLTAACPVPNTSLRLQINWISKSGTMLDVALRPTSCGPQEEVYSAELSAPAAAAAGVVIVGGHDRNTVLVDRVSLRR